MYTGKKSKKKFWFREVLDLKVVVNEFTKPRGNLRIGAPLKYGFFPILK